MTETASNESKAEILVVEDESGMRTTLCMLLKLEGYSVNTATNGVAGLTLAEKQPPDLVITDYAMPFMDGLEMIQTIRSDPARYGACLILLMSAYLPPDTKMEDVGDSFIAKPITMHRLLEIVDLLLRQRS